ncbi:MAG: VWA domain-containing protein [Spirochaetia bacterium]|nr:VWA domain-containing protein [Spirochaetia bacterium]
MFQKALFSTLAFSLFYLTACSSPGGGQSPQKFSRNFEMEEKSRASAAAEPGPLSQNIRDKKGDLKDRYNQNFNTEDYDRIYENAFLDAKQKPLSTFSIDVDTASYANVRRFLKDGRLPPKDAVRIEEMINYFSYSYPSPSDDTPFSISTEVSKSPWNPENRLLLIGLKGKSIAEENLPARNLVFLLDVSGSMMARNKLPLLVKSMKMLTDQLSEKDTVSIVVYAGASGLVLPATSGYNKNKIMDSLNQLQAGGSTNGGAGIELAYKIARENFKPEGINRVILATDGDFNVGVSSQGDLIRMIEKKRESGIFLTVLGFGSGNLKDSTMEKLADKGNGNYAYIDSESEAAKVLVKEAGSTLVTIAKDVKIQIEFNPAQIHSYRLIGYENRILNSEDFNDDKKDAGEIGAGHNVTALYEIVPAGNAQNSISVDPLKYQTESRLNQTAGGNEIATVKIRYKNPRGMKSSLIERTVKAESISFGQSSENLRLAAGVAAFGMILRDSKYKGNADFNLLKEILEGAKGTDPNGYRAELLSLVDRAENLLKR